MLRLLTVISVLIFLLLANIFPLHAEDVLKYNTGNYLAVFDIATTGTVDKDLSFPLSESIRREFVMSSKYKVLDRSNMNRILGDGCMTGQCPLKTGQLPGVEKIITGSVSRLGNAYYLTLSLINLQTGKIEEISEDTCRCEADELIEATKRLVQRLLGKKVADKPQPRELKPLSSATPANKQPTPYYSQPSKTADTQDQSAPARQPATEAGPANKAETPLAVMDQATGTEFILVKGGCYDMGDTFGDGDSDEEPIHKVCVDDYYLGKYDITVGEFGKFTKETAYRTEAESGGGCSVWNGNDWKQDRSKSWKDPGFSQDQRDPVVCVSWNDAKAFAEWMGRKSGKTVRLPREAEWEYAARSGGTQERYAGGNDIESVAWFGLNSGKRTHPVGTKAPNGLGLYDMSGNVYQWCEDWYNKNYYSNSLRDFTAGPATGENRVLRGGSWYDDARNLRAASRCNDLPGVSVSRYGFRVVRTP